MKKLLGILVLGLLLGGCAFTPEEQRAWEQKSREAGYKTIEYFNKANDNVAQLESKGIDRIYVGNNFWTIADFTQAANICAQKKKFFFYFRRTTWLEKDRTGIKAPGQVAYCSIENLNTDPVYGLRIPSGSAYNFWENDGNRREGTNFNAALKASWENSDVKPIEDSKDLLANIKNTCMEFGYKEGTDKLADCMKDLYLKQTQPTTIVQGTTTTTTKPKRKIDPSVWDDLINMSIGTSQGASVTEALGGVSSTSESKIQCFKTGERVSGTNKICSYNCMGSETTRNIPSTRICPMSIDLN